LRPRFKGVPPLAIAAGVSDIASLSLAFFKEDLVEAARERGKLSGQKHPESVGVTASGNCKPSAGGVDLCTGKEEGSIYTEAHVELPAEAPEEPQSEAEEPTFEHMPGDWEEIIINGNDVDGDGDDGNELDEKPVEITGDEMTAMQRCVSRWCFVALLGIGTVYISIV
jgi:hypothetical protein